MRAAFVIVSAFVALAACGAKGDLIIGEIKLAAGGGGGSTAGTGVDPTAGAALGGVGAGAGTGATAGAQSGQTGDPPVQAGAAGMGAGGDNACPVEEEVPAGSLLHRYSFDGTGTGAGAVVDSAGTKNGNLEAGATLDGSGILTLPGRVNGKADQFVSFSGPIIKGLTDVTFVIWTSWITGGAGFQRILDFGDSNVGAGQGDSGKSYLALVPTSNFANGDKLGAELAAPGFPTLSLGSDKNMADAVEVQVALVVRSGAAIELYREGELLIQSPTNVTLAKINDVNNWLGRSQWSKDHGFHGTYDEFRIYGSALSACQLTTLRDRGPDTL
jgi:Concanavalin A-like lectin/glucanases superfamily